MKVASKVKAIVIYKLELALLYQDINISSFIVILIIKVKSNS